MAYTWSRKYYGEEWGDEDSNDLMQLIDRWEDDEQDWLNEPEIETIMNVEKKVPVWQASDEKEFTDGLMKSRLHECGESLNALEACDAELPF